VVSSATHCATYSTTSLPKTSCGAGYGGVMTPPVVAMLHEWRLRLNAVNPDTRDGVLQLLGLPDPLDTVALQALGISRLEIDSSISSVTVRFLVPLLSLPYLVIGPAAYVDQEIFMNLLTGIMARRCPPQISPSTFRPNWCAIRQIQASCSVLNAATACSFHCINTPLW
jgi:hypothetical protein